jgi:uncharacterized protein
MRTFIIGLFMLVAGSGSANGSPALPVSSITVETHGGLKVFRVEVAADPQSQEQGLMYRRDLKPNAGMLFEFHSSMMLSFWMKNTFLPLDMLFIRSDGTISTIAANTTPFSSARIDSAEPVCAVLEINGGRARELGIRSGDRVHAAIFHNFP